MKTSKKIISLAVTMMLLLCCITVPTIASAEAPTPTWSADFENTSVYTVGETFVGKSSWQPTLGSSNTCGTPTVYKDGDNTVGKVSFSAGDGEKHCRIGAYPSSGSWFSQDTKQMEVKFSIKRPTNNLKILRIQFRNAKNSDNNVELYVDFKGNRFKSITGNDTFVDNAGINAVDSWVDFKFVITDEATAKHTNVYIGDSSSPVVAWDSTASGIDSFPNGIYFINSGSDYWADESTQATEYYLDNISVTPYTQAQIDAMATEPAEEIIFSDSFDTGDPVVGTDVATYNEKWNLNDGNGATKKIADDNGNKVFSMKHAATDGSSINARLGAYGTWSPSDDMDYLEVSFRVKRLQENAKGLNIVLRDADTSGSSSKNPWLLMEFANDRMRMNQDYMASDTSDRYIASAGINKVGQWIDFKMVMERNKNINVYVDGVLKKTWEDSECGLYSFPTGVYFYTMQNNSLYADMAAGTDKEAELYIDDVVVKAYNEGYSTVMKNLQEKLNGLSIEAGTEFEGAKLPTGITKVISESFTLPTVDGVNIAWESSNTDIISISGNSATVTKPENSSVNEDVVVTGDNNSKRYFPLVDLTATMTKDSASVRKTIRVAVEPVYKSYFTESVGVADSKLYVGVQNCFEFNGDNTVECYAAVIREGQLIGVGKATEGSYTSSGTQEATFATNLGVQNNDTVKAFFWKPGTLKPYSKKLNVVYTASTAE